MCLLSHRGSLLVILCSIDAAHGRVELSLRLSRVDPEAAKKARKKQEKEKRKGEGGKKVKRRHSTSDGESLELESAESR